MVYFLLICNDHIPSTPECIEAYFEPLVRLSLSVWSIFCHSTSHAKSSIMNYYYYLLWARMIPCLLQCNHLENDWPTTSSLLTYLIFFEVTFQKYYLGTYYSSKYREYRISTFSFYFFRSLWKWESLCSKLLQHSQWNVWMRVSSRFCAQWQRL